MLSWCPEGFGGELRVSGGGGAGSEQFLFRIEWPVSWGGRLPPPPSYRNSQLTVNLIMLLKYKFAMYKFLQYTCYQIESLEYIYLFDELFGIFLKM